MSISGTNVGKETFAFDGEDESLMNQTLRTEQERRDTKRTSLNSESSIPSTSGSTKISLVQFSISPVFSRQSGAR